MSKGHDTKGRPIETPADLRRARKEGALPIRYQVDSLDIFEARRILVLAEDQEGAVEQP